MISIVVKIIGYCILIFGVCGALGGFAFGPGDNINPVRFAIFAAALVIPVSLIFFGLGKVVKPKRITTDHDLSEGH